MNRLTSYRNMFIISCLCASAVFLTSPSYAELTEVGRIELPRYSHSQEHVRSKIHVEGDFAYIGDMMSRRVNIFNVADKSNPQYVSSILTNYGDIHEIWYADGYVYTGHRFGGINMIDVSNPYAPVIVDYRNDGYIHKGLMTVNDRLYSGKQCH